MLGHLFEGCLQIDTTVRTAGTLAQAPQPVPTCKGIAAFADSEDRCISMLTAANIRRTATHRLFSENPDEPGRRGSIAHLVGTLYYRCCYNDYETTLRYLQAVRVIWPDSWQSMISLPKMWFVGIDMTAQWPNFTITEKPGASPGRKLFGLFPTRKAASRYSSLLQAAFALCRRPDLIDSADKAATCPYLQMGTCPAPCVGSISRQEYGRQIENAASGAEVRLRFAEDLRRQMLEFAARRQFEEAAVMKKRLEALDMLNGSDYAWTHDLADLAILHIDRWAKIVGPQGRRKVQSYAGYLIAGEHIHCLGPFTLDQTENFLREANCRIKEFGPQNNPDDAKLNLAMTAGLLYRNNPPGIWFNCSGSGLQYNLPAPEEVAARIACKSSGEPGGGSGD